MKLAIVSDEISRDFDTAVELGLSWGFRRYEIRNLGSGRVPKVDEAEISRLLATREKHDLTITSISSGLFKIEVDHPDLERRIVEDLPAACDLAHRLNTQAIVDFGFRKPGAACRDALGEVSGVDYPQQVVDLLGRIADEMAKHDCAFFLENEHVCWADTGEATGRIVTDVSRPNLFVNWDPTNAAHFTETVFPDGYDAVKPFVKHVHIKDFLKSPAFQVVVPGEGETDWPAQLRALIADGYDGYLVVETHMAPKVESSRRCAAAVKDMLCEICG